ncbi:MAG TPA: deoxyguanosinetriphosphate triphosphohydrolase, partial [Gammaproteobacteria bacterium]|nr:deoxyguanosinetriphosphate triphosphohydrolase [Gammaproteobacteria bacterium]
MQNLAPYAANPELSQGRNVYEAPPDHRSEYQRDRDRIVHCTGFRRLEYKTQVFVNHEGDLFRTRLTHSIEVAQIGRAIARTLKLNEDLTEAIALAHDIGHTPFGHAGQEALNQCMKEYGGFEHNLQSLRVLDVLEQKYANFDGLNLTFETREGILKHCSKKNAQNLGPLGTRFLKQQQPSLEAQLANLADEIAYNNHDVDDGLRAGLIKTHQLQAVKLYKDQCDEVMALYPGLSERRKIHEIIRRMINCLVSDLVETSQNNLRQANIQSVEQVRSHSQPLIAFGAEMRALNLELKQFLRTKLYSHYRVYRMSNKAKNIVSKLFEAFINDPGLLPEEHFQGAIKMERETGHVGRARAVAD